jgi:hypothetical protein
MTLARESDRTGLLAALSQQRLSADGEDQDAEKAGHVLREGRRLSGLQEVVEEQEIHSEKAEDECDIECSSHAGSLALGRHGLGLSTGPVFRNDP